MKLFFLALFTITLAPAALAQADAPQNSDYDTSMPADDAGYADDSAGPAAASEGAADAPTDADYNTTPPADDAAWFDAPVAPDAASVPDAPADATPTSSAPAGTPPAKTPGFEAALLLSLGSVLALAVRRR